MDGAGEAFRLGSADNLHGAAEEHSRVAEPALGLVDRGRRVGVAGEVADLARLARGREQKDALQVPEPHGDHVWLAGRVDRGQARYRAALQKAIDLAFAQPSRPGGLAL